MCRLSISQTTRLRSSSTSLYTMDEVCFSTSFSLLGNASEWTFSHSWAENIFFDMFFVFGIDKNIWIVRQKAGTSNIASRHIHLWITCMCKIIGYCPKETRVFHTLQVNSNYPFQAITRRTDKHKFGLKILIGKQSLLQVYEIWHMVKVNTHQTGVHQQIIFSTLSEQTRKGAIVKMRCFIALGFSLISEIAQCPTI